MRMCPCCEQPAVRRAEPVTEEQAAKGYVLMLAQGWTAERLLAERREDLDYIHPSMTAFIERQVAAKTKPM